MKKSVPDSLAVPNSLGEKACAQIVKSLNPLVADVFALYVKTKNFHWHLSGPHFRDYHLLFDEQAEKIFEMIDILAERVRKLGGTTIRSIGHISELQSIKDDDDLLVTAKDMLQRLLKDNQILVENIRKAHKICGENGDFATTSILEIFLDEAERRIWFLFESRSV